MASVGSPSSLPKTLHWATIALFVQAAVLTVLAAIFLYADLTSIDVNARLAYVVNGYVLLVAVAMAFLGAKLRQRRRWSRGPAVALELLLVPFGIFVAQGGQPLIGLPVAALGLTVTWLLISTPTREALEGDRGSRK